MLNWFRKDFASAERIDEHPDLPVGRHTSSVRPREPAQDVSDLAKRYDAALDVVGHLVRSYGEHAFEIDEASADDTRGTCERWVRHLLTGAAHPADIEHASGEMKRPVAHNRRDWSGIGRFFLKHRRSEEDFVRRLRDLVWKMMSGVRSAFAGDKRDDERLKSELIDLKHVAATASLTELQEYVMNTVESVEKSIADRQARQRDELAAIGAHLREMKSELVAAQHKAATDPLTRLQNRASLDAHMKTIIEMAELTQEPICMLMVDIDHFKKINDHYGHAAGDAALRAVADSIVRVASRRSDFVARYGGEEFSIILGDTPLAGALRVAERLVEAVRKLRIKIRTQEDKIEVLTLTFSVGVAAFIPDHGADAWMARADQALYRAKEEGRNRWLVAD